MEKLKLKPFSKNSSVYPIHLLLTIDIVDEYARFEFIDGSLAL